MLVWGRQTVIVAWGPRRPMWQLARRCCSSGTHAPTSQARQARRLPRLTLYTGTDCQLCDVAKSVLDDVARDVPFELVEYNIRDNSLEGVKQWRRAYQYDIPVLHLEDKEIARHRLDKMQVVSAIRAHLA